MQADPNSTLKKWQEKIAAKLLLWKDKLIHSGTDLAYGTLCAAALTPVIETMQTGDPSFLLALTASIGTNLIATQIQTIKDAGEEGSPRWLQSQAAENPKIQQELDVILEKLDVIELARGTMTAEERGAFFEQLKESLPSESPRINEDRSVFVQGNLRYSIVNTGDGVKITYYGPGSTHQETHIHAPDPLETAAREKQQKLSQYLAAFAKECQILPLLPLGGGTTSDLEVTLDQIYIDLCTRLPIKFEMTDIPVKKLAHDLPRLVVLGDPGSGKSTFVKMIARSAAIDWMEKSTEPTLGTQLIPVILILRELVEELQTLDPTHPDKDLVLSQFKALMEKALKRFGIEGFENGFLRYLRDQPTLLIFDGMDEVPQNLRQMARIWVETVVGDYHPEKVILTCRSRSYFKEAVLTGYPSFKIEPFNEDQIEKFTKAWYRTKQELRLNEQESRAEDFFQRVKADENLFEMATNPLLLTQMAVLHQRDTRLPDQRVKLYEEIVQLLLYRWQDHSGAHFKMSDELAKLMKESDKVRLSLEHLAFTIHRTAKGEEEATDLKRITALEILNQQFQSYGLAEEFLRYLDQRSGLLQGKGGTTRQADTYTFPHRTFQEYLAGCFLNRQNQHAKLRLLAEIAGEGDFWDVVFQLSIEERVHIGKDPNLVDLAADLCTYCEETSENGHRMVYWSALLANLLGEETIQAFDDPTLNIAVGSEYLSTLREKLLRVSTGISLTPIERAEAADALDGLGYVPEDLYTFVEIPGDDKVPTFWMGKYPVTNRQYARFLTPENFLDKSLWMDLPDLDAKGQQQGNLADEAWLWLQNELKDKDVLTPRHWERSRFGQERPCAPVVGVSWYEAMAYARWMQRQWDQLQEAIQNQRIKPGLICLPVDIEWEKAAGGTDNDRYAWNGPGESTDRERLTNFSNIEESGIGRTTPVWTYPQGQSFPYGLFDMTGNVWEWQANRKINTGIRVLRGGSFDFYHSLARCAHRYGHYIYLKRGDVGFRLCMHTL
jgi:formylglycine-generating enzyme required for sulfatase activity